MTATNAQVRSSRVGYCIRFCITIAYYCCSLTTSSLMLAYVTLLGHGNVFCKRVRGLLAVVTCAPWMLCFGVRLAIQNEELIFPVHGSSRLIHIGTHASHLDGLSMMVAYWRARVFRIPPCAMVKQEVLLTPFYGIFAYLVGNIFLARGSTKNSAVESMERCAERINQGYVLGAFPEGTRRREKSVGKSHLLPYKKGVFHLASKMRQNKEPVTIVPFCLIGSRTAWPVNRMLPFPGSKITLKFLKHITPTEDTSVEQILDMTRSAHEAGIENAARNPSGSYDVDNAFRNGVEVDLVKEFLFEAILLVIPPIVILSLAILGML